MRTSGDGDHDSSDEEDEDETEFASALDGGFEKADRAHARREREREDEAIAGGAAAAAVAGMRGKSIYGMKHAAFGSSVRRDAPVDHAKRVDERRRVLRQSVRGMDKDKEHDASGGEDTDGTRHGAAGQSSGLGDGVSASGASGAGTASDGGI